MHHFWIDYPVAHKRLDPAFKLYYFGVLGYWLHHCAGLVIEGYQRLSVERARSQGRKQQAKVPKRSDYGALAVHHVVTVSLVALSYYMHFTRIGHVTMVLLDVADILLPLAKILKYTGKQTVCDVAFAIFTLSWIATRHYFLLLLCYSIYKDPFTYIPEEYRSWDPNGTESFYSMNVYYVFNTLFAALQILLIYWLAMVIKVVVKVVQGGKAEDVRSDDEEEESELTEVDDAMTEKSIKRKAGNASSNQRPASGVELRNGDWGTVKESSVRSRRRH
ncbi:sphingosine N-acyltransferase lag1 [Gaertneriomyces sp. JEL0708]|nr:sphingosine N-acyltransferase lag1 [Gaertneriomyces sp. JEL0708]